MTGQLRAHVYRDRTSGHWVTEVDDPTTINVQSTWQLRSYSHPEAMQAAHKMLHDLDHMLMEPVHASRAARRHRCQVCESPVYGDQVMCDDCAAVAAVKELAR